MKVKNWKKFQHFKDRTPPWIKLHKCLLDDQDYHALDAYDAKYLILLWLLASEDESKLGTLPGIGKIAFRLRISTEKAKSLINRLSHWVIQDDITPISERYHDGPPESESESESQEKTEGEAPKIKRGLGDWVVNEAHRVLAQQLGVNVESEETKFRDYLAANGKRYSDYDAAFRNWLKNSQKFNGGGNGGRKLQDDRLSVGKAAERLRDSGFSIPPRPSLVFGTGEGDRRLLPKGRGS